MAAVKRFFASNNSFGQASIKASTFTLYTPIINVDHQTLPRSSVEDDAARLNQSPNTQLPTENSMLNPEVQVNTDIVKDTMNFRETVRLSFEFCFLWVWTKPLTQTKYLG